MKIRYKEMKKNNRASGRKILFATVAFLIVGSLTASAQIGLPSDPNIPDAPIDGFLAVGLIAGACIGLRKRIKGLKE